MDEQYNIKNAAYGLTQACVSISLLDQTRSEIESLEKRLAAKKELIDLLENEPKLQRVLDLMMNKY